MLTKINTMLTKKILILTHACTVLLGILGKCIL